MAHVYKLPLRLDPQPEGGYTVTSPILPGLISEGETVEEALTNARDAFQALLESYEDAGYSLPAGICQNPSEQSIDLEFAFSLP